MRLRLETRWSDGQLIWWRIVYCSDWAVWPQVAQAADGRWALPWATVQCYQASEHISPGWRQREVCGAGTGQNNELHAQEIWKTPLLLEAIFIWSATSICRPVDRLDSHQRCFSGAYADKDSFFPNWQKISQTWSCKKQELQLSLSSGGSQLVPMLFWIESVVAFAFAS